MDYKKISVDVECCSPFICSSCPAFDLTESTLFADDQPHERLFSCSHLAFCQKLLPKVEAFFENKLASAERNGAWVKSEILCEGYVCSECGGAAWYYDVGKTVLKSRFCPNCGARMEGGSGGG